MGVGYRAAVEGSKVVFALGYSHPVEYQIPEGIKIAVDKQTRVTVTGIDRQKVGPGGGRDPRACASRTRTSRRGSATWARMLKKKAGKAGATGGAK